MAIAWTGGQYSAWTRPSVFSVIVTTLTSARDPTLTAAPLADTLPPHRAARLARDITAAAALGTTAVALATAGHVAPAALTGYGLISVVPFLVWLALAALAVSFALHVSAPTISPARLGAHLIACVLLLHGLPGFLEQEPRFSSAWVTVGIVDAIIKHGHPYTTVDARFSWPGFFTTAAAYVGMNGWRSALPVLRWAPVVSNLLYSLPIFVIAKLSLRSTRTPWIVVWLFVLLNWIGQDYFSPQGFAYFLFLAIIATVLASFSRVDESQLARVRRVGDWLQRSVATRWGRGEAAPPPFSHPFAVNLSARQATGVFAIVFAGALSLVMSHQLTPYVVALDVTALVLARRCRLTFLPAILVALLAVWLSYAAFDYWVGHLAELFGSGGTSSVSSSLSNKIAGSTSHLAVVYVRVAVAVGVWTIAAGSCVWSYFRRRPIDLTVLLLSFAPLPLALLQSYGGEAQLRLYLYTLPFMICLVVSAFSSDQRRWSRRGVIGLLSVTVALIPTFLVARFGNEIFEQVRPNEVAAAQALYRLAPKGSTLVALMPNGITWQFRDFADYTYETASGLTPRAVLRVIADHSAPSFLLVTRGQIEYAITSFGATSGGKVNRRLAASPAFKLIYSNPDAQIYRVLPRSSRPSAGPSGRILPPIHGHRPIPARRQHGPRKPRLRVPRPTHKANSRRPGHVQRSKHTHRSRKPKQ
jgi:hypothetical protein